MPAMYFLLHTENSINLLYPPPQFSFVFPSNYNTGEGEGNCRSNLVPPPLYLAFFVFWPSISKVFFIDIDSWPLATSVGGLPVHRHHNPFCLMSGDSETAIYPQIVDFRALFVGFFFFRSSTLKM
jgi:hypothetical protein